jgi:hypothetical protein
MGRSQASEIKTLAKRRSRNFITTCTKVSFSYDKEK